MVLKVKEPIAEEYHRLREDLTLFTYLHLAADKPLTDELLSAQDHRDRLRDGAAALGRAAAALPDVRGRGLPRAPGRRPLADAGPGWPRRAAWAASAGVANAKVVIIGAGVSGQNAANIALGMGADVTLLDTDLDKLRMSFWRYNNRVHGLASSALAIRAAGHGGRHGDRRRADPRRRGAQAGQQRAGLADEAGLGAGRHRRRPGRLLRGHPRRPPTPTRRTWSTTRSSTAWPTCPARCPTPRRTPSPTRRCRTPSRWPTRAGSRPAATTRACSRASTPTPARSPTCPWARRVGIDAVAPESVLP